MLDRRSQLLYLLRHEHESLRRLVAADELAQALRILLRDLATHAHDVGNTWEDIGRGYRAPGVV